MTSEWIKHDGSARCPVEDDAIVGLDDTGTGGQPIVIKVIATDCDWKYTDRYQLISGWNRPIEDIFAELPDEAEWIAQDKNGCCYTYRDYELELLAGSWGRTAYSNLGTRGTYVGDWCESKRKRPKRDRAFDLAREATAGQLDSLKEIIKRGGVEAVLDNCVDEPESAEIERVDLPIHYTMTNAELLEAIKHFTGLVGTKSARQDEKFIRHLDMLMDVQRSRAVASFTAKVERTTYENGGE